MKLNQIKYLLCFTLTSLILSNSLIAQHHEKQEEGANEATHHPHWSYVGEMGPEHWGELSEEYIAAEIGKSQSPIDLSISGSVQTDLDNINFHYSNSNLKVKNNGHTIVCPLEGNNSITVDGDSFELLQFHFHSLSEHTVNGQHFPLEAHFVHKDDKGNLAVVGVFFVEGNENSTLKNIWMHLPKSEGEVFEPEEMLNPEKLLPVDRRFFRYSGSLTTPPCTEGVKWFVMSAPMEMSGEQLKAFQKIYNNNYRPVQPHNARLINLDTKN